MRKILLISGFIIALASFIGIANAAEVWDLTGVYEIDYLCTSGCSGTYTHTMDVDSMDLMTGVFSGTGFYNPNNSYTWDVEGTVADSDVDFLVTYTGSNPGYTVDAAGTIANDGTMSGTAESSSGQTFTWSTTTGVATFQRDAEITSPDENEVVYGEVEFAAYLIDNDEDFVDWAARKGTCDAGTNTVFGNVDGHSDVLAMTYNPAEYKYSYSVTTDVSSWVPGMYCFIFNPREDSGEEGIRLTREFYIADVNGYVSGGGQIREDIDGDGVDKNKDDYKISFGGQVWDLGSEGYAGDWQINFHNVGDDKFDKARFHATEITAINFFTGNSNTCDEAMNMTLLGTLNGEEEYKVIFRAGDFGTGRDHDTSDTVRVELFNTIGTKIYDTHWGTEFTDESSCVGTARTGLDAGNITIEF